MKRIIVPLKKYAHNLTYLCFLGFLFFASNSINAQVGINTTTPNAQLEIQSTNQATPSNTDGILIPKIDEFPLTNPTISQDGMMVFVTGSGTPAKGFYYWNNPTATWILFNGSGAEKIDDLTDGKSDNDGSLDGSSIFLGINAGLNDDSSQNQNIGLGYQSLMTNTTGYGNTGLGYRSLENLTNSNGNVAIGSSSLISLTTGNFNTGVGADAMHSNQDGNYNSGVGSAALYHNTDGRGNIAIGTAASGDNTTGDYNVALGFQTLRTNLTGDYNVAVGYHAGYNETGSNRLYIENSDADANNALIYGQFDTNILRTNSQFQIGNPTGIGFAFPTIDGTANQVLQTDGSGQLSWVDETTIGTDDQNLTGATLTGNTLQIDIENGTSTSVDMSSLNTGGDITGVTAGTGLTGGGNSGTVILNAEASNGITANANDIVLGGTLTQPTTIRQNTNNLTFNLNSTGDFIVKASGATAFEVLNTRIANFKGRSFWYDTPSGNLLAAIWNFNDDGRFTLYENGISSIDLNAASATVFNDQGLDRDFRIESVDQSNLFRVDAANSRIGIKVAAPSFDIHLKQSSITQAGAGGMGFESSTSSNNWKIYHSGTHFSFAENGTRRAYIEGGTGNYVQPSDERLKRDFILQNNYLSKVKNINIYSYLYKSQTNNKRNIGLKAQELQQLFPELITEGEDGYLGMNYAGLGVIAIQAIKEQQKEIALLKKENEALKEKQKSLEGRLQKIEQLVRNKN